MRVATYYLESGREVDVYSYGSSYTAQDAFLEEITEFDHFPTWNEVSEKWLTLTPV